MKSFLMNGYKINGVENLSKEDMILIKEHITADTPEKIKNTGTKEKKFEVSDRQLSLIFSIAVIRMAEKMLGVKEATPLIESPEFNILLFFADNLYHTAEKDEILEVMDIYKKFDEIL